jgi:hypothetical protein
MVHAGGGKLKRSRDSPRSNGELNYPGFGRRSNAPVRQASGS